MTRLNASERAYNAGRQDWFVCTDGWRHELLEETKEPYHAVVKMTCPKCGYSETGDNPTVMAHSEAAHKSGHLMAAK